MAKNKARGCFGWILIFVGTIALLIGLLMGIGGTQSDNEKTAENKKAWAEFTEWVESDEGQRYDSLNQALMTAVGEDSVRIEQELQTITPVEQPMYRMGGIGAALAWVIGGVIIIFGLMLIFIGGLIYKNSK